MPGRLRPVSRRALVGAAAVSTAAVLIGARALRFAGASLPVLGVAAWLPLLLLAAATAWIARGTARALAERPDALEPEMALARLRLAQASEWTAVVLGGAYLGLALVAGTDWPVPGELWRALHGLAAAVGAACWWAAAAWLERVCLVEPPDDADSLSA